MKSNEKKAILVIISIFAVVIIGLLIARGMKKEDNTPEPQKPTNVTENQQNEPYTEKLSDGTRQNTSNRLQQKKIVEGLEISNIRMSEKNNVTIIFADVTNNSSESIGNFGVRILVKDDKGNTIDQTGGVIQLVKPGETVELNASTAADFANCYDIEIIKE